MLAFFDPLITESATKGFYVVFLVNAQTEEVTLSLNQGTTAVYEEFGRKRGRDVLKRRAIDMAERVPEIARKFERSPIDLGSAEDLPIGYQAGHSFGRTYTNLELNSDIMISDLEQMLHAYELLINRGGTTPVDFMQEEAGTTEVEETRRYFLSRRIERSKSVRKEVLRRRKPICECCGLDPEKDYGYKGNPIGTPLDIHHAAPLHGLSEGETRRYKIPQDFLVLCPTCHRMIHKQDDPSNLKQLKAKIRFKFMRETEYPIL